MKLLGRILTVLALVMLLTGCTSFEQDWRHARVQSPAQTGAVTGPWQGTWLSDVNRHTGELRCLVTQKNQNEYEFRFKATYWKLFRFSYIVHMPVVKSPQGFTFKGDENLGYLAGGVYSYTGSIVETNLNATYSCKFDHGTFQLTRP